MLRFVSCVAAATLVICPMGCTAPEPLSEPPLVMVSSAIEPEVALLIRGRILDVTRAEAERVIGSRLATDEEKWITTLTDLGEVDFERETRLPPLWLPAGGDVQLSDVRPHDYRADIEETPDGLRIVPGRVWEGWSLGFAMSADEPLQVTHQTSTVMATPFLTYDTVIGGQAVQIDLPELHATHRQRSLDIEGPMVLAMWLPTEEQLRGGTETDRTRLVLFEVRPEGKGFAPPRDFVLGLEAR